MQGICEGVEHHLWSNDSRPASRGIRALRSSKPFPRCTAVRVEGDELLTEESEVKARWAGYFERLYQADPPVVGLDVRGVTILVADHPINCGPPSLVETQAAVNRLKWGKAPGICSTHAELLKAGGNAVLVSLHAVLCSAWNTGIILTDWKRGLVVPLRKGKGDRQDCNNYRGVTLLSVLCKVFARIILYSACHHLLEHQHPEQSGFTPKRSTIDRILALRVLTKRRREFWQGLLAAYVDLCKVFDSVNRDALWKILGLCGAPPKLINLMSELHSGPEIAVWCGDTISDLFPVVTAVHQSLFLPPHF